MATQLLLLGGNQGDVIKNLQQAIEVLSLHLGKAIQTSAYYESAPWGFAASQNFINQVVEFESSFTPDQLLGITQQIEIQLGRKQKTGTHYESRPIDIDILFIDDCIINTPHLIIPHPRLHQRRFTLLPLLDHWQDLWHPKLGKTIRELLSICEDDGIVNRLD
ncbi:MAG: 2-amino-4-hydroxy-6-hydroxymethyldihydropteridine diphosphokinase [Marinilabiliaceae bacterium]|nr:2-amino-4-hydroxy-6-hydroxymethyldihydropteridine diphosphokinase [Marinilabiliaceae bacterium]